MCMDRRVQRARTASKNLDTDSCHDHDLFLVKRAACQFLSHLIAQRQFRNLSCQLSLVFLHKLVVLNAELQYTLIHF